MKLTADHPTHNTAVEVKQTLDTLVWQILKEIEVFQQRGMRGDDTRVTDLQPRLAAYRNARNALATAGL